MHFLTTTNPKPVPGMMWTSHSPALEERRFLFAVHREFLAAFDYSSTVEVCIPPRAFPRFQEPRCLRIDF
jgi:hypothetical protein